MVNKVMRSIRSSRFILIIVILVACGRGAPQPEPARAVPGAAYTEAASPSTVIPSPADLLAWLTPQAQAALESLQKVDEHPLYVMHYAGDYPPEQSTHTQDFLPSSGLAEPAPSWACSLFAALADPQSMLYGRNFDWPYSPALLYFSDPPEGYASVSMVDITPLGYDENSVADLDQQPPEKLQNLLYAYTIPFDGMNEMGLVVAMAAVPQATIASDPEKDSIGSLGILREVLDNAADVDQALEIFQGYNIEWSGGVPLHYLIADRSGRALLIEFDRGKLKTLPNSKPWHQATNFTVSPLVSRSQGQCWRYDKLAASLERVQGWLDAASAMDLLSEVAQDITQWSVVYSMSTGSVDIVMGRQYRSQHQFSLLLQVPGK